MVEFPWKAELIVMLFVRDIRLGGAAVKYRRRACLQGTLLEGAPFLLCMPSVEDKSLPPALAHGSSI